MVKLLVKQSKRQEILLLIWMKVHPEVMEATSGSQAMLTYSYSGSQCYANDGPLKAITFVVTVLRAVSLSLITIFL